jgi:8-oxo-dGTP pyrophosphatase MutT (NUDIX family)
MTDHSIKLLLEPMPPQTEHETLLFPISIDPAQEVYRDPYTVINRQTAHFDGFTKEYYCMEKGLRAAIIPIRGHEILLTRQYRFMANRISIEIPGGGVNGGEQPMDAAVRECFEETGIRCLNPQPLINFQPGLDIYHNPSFIFVSEQLEDADSANNERFLWMPFDEAESRVYAEEINDALSVIGILALAKRFRRPA